MAEFLDVSSCSTEQWQANEKTPKSVPRYRLLALEAPECVIALGATDTDRDHWVGSEAFGDG